MLDFHKYLMRHGESAVQAIVEHIEHSEGISPDSNQSLEARWEIAMRAYEKKQAA